MTTIIGLSGSLRAGSFNTMLLRATKELFPPTVTFEEATIRGIPLYDGDEEARAFPEVVTALKERIVAADGVLLVTPEYNNSFPGVVKNAIDWLSRPPPDAARVFGNKPFGLIGATLGQGATTLAQAAWLPVLRTLGTLPYFAGRLGVSGASRVFDEHGTIIDASVRERLAKYVQGFATFVAEQSGTRG